MWHFRAELKDKRPEFKEGAVAELLLPQLVRFFPQAMDDRSNFPKRRKKHFALTGDSEGGEEAGEVHCLMPLILLTVEASQRGSERVPETGTEEKTAFSSWPSSKIKPIFFLCYCAKTCLHREHESPDSGDKLRYITRVQ